MPLAVLVAAPLRPPLVLRQLEHASSCQIANDGRLGRLLPLYFVLAAAAAALGWRALRGGDLRALPEAIALAGRRVLRVRVLLAPVGGRRGGRHEPAALLHAAVRRAAGDGRARADYPDWAPRGLAGAALALASLFAAVGLWQAATHKLFFYAPNLAASNANTDYFRVTSLFGDPSLYGRHVVLGIGVALTLLATRRWRTWPLIGLIVADVGGPAVLLLAVEHGRAAAS